MHRQTGRRGGRGIKSRESHRRESNFYVRSGRDAPCTYAAAMCPETVQPSRHHPDGIPVGAAYIRRTGDREKKRMHTDVIRSRPSLSPGRSVCRLILALIASTLCAPSCTALVPFTQFIYELASTNGQWSTVALKVAAVRRRCSPSIASTATERRIARYCSHLITRNEITDCN